LNHQLLNPSSSSAASVSSFASPAVDVLKVNTNQKAPVVVVGDDKKDEVKAGEPAVVKQQQQQQPSRCLTCRRRVGLTGFKCRCGMVFCGTHRYPEQHDCEFDFKSLGKQQIAKANPVVKGEKLQKI
jgi:predicted nucleic acid binding AN1-type Zn finger protein